MKKSELKEIIRECIEEARSHGGKSVGNNRFRTNTIYGGDDRLSRREKLANHQPLKRSKSFDRQRFIKGSIALDKAYPPESFYYINSRGKGEDRKPKSSYKKSGIGRKGK